MRKLVLLSVLVVISLILIQAVVIVNNLMSVSDDLDIKGRTVQASASLCINVPAILNNTCPSEFYQSTRIENNTVHCSFDVTYPYTADVDINVLGTPPPGVFIDLDGNNVTLWANNTGVGQHMFFIQLIDQSDCPLINEYTYFYEVLFVNDPPEFIGSLRSLRVNEGETVVGIYTLNNEFTDPDDPVLNYTVYGAENFVVTINDDSSVNVRNPSGNCDDEEEIYFRATDPHGLYDESNMVTLEPVCAEQQDTDEPTSAGAPRDDDCTPEWVCVSWSTCLINGTQYRDCYDTNGCDPDNTERRFWRECEYIPPQDIEDEEEEELEEEVEEEPIQIETPAPPVLDIDDEGVFTTALLIALAVAITTIVYYGFRKEIRTLYARIHWYLTRKQRKQILLSDEDKNSLLKEVNMLAEKLSVSDSIIETNNKDFRKLVSINKNYYAKALNLKEQYSLEEFKKASEKKIYVEALQNAFKLGYAKSFMLWNKKVNLTKTSVFAYIQELRQLIINTSSSTKKDITFKVSELPLRGVGYEKVIAAIHNAYLALQFKDVENAKRYYLKCIELYEDLDDRGKTRVHNEISRLYEYLTYVISWTIKK